VGRACPPANISAGRKFATTGTRSAEEITAASPVCHVQASCGQHTSPRGPDDRGVCPWQPIRSSFTLRFSTVAATASA